MHYCCVTKGSNATLPLLLTFLLHHTMCVALVRAWLSTLLQRIMPFCYSIFRFELQYNPHVGRKWNYESMNNPSGQFIIVNIVKHTVEPPHDKTNKMTVRPAKTDQPGHPPSLIRVFAVRMKIAWVLCYPLSASEDWSDWVDAQADLSLRWAHSHCVGFLLRWLSYYRHRLFFFPQV